MFLSFRFSFPFSQTNFLPTVKRWSSAALGLYHTISAQILSKGDFHFQEVQKGCHGSHDSPKPVLVVREVKYSSWPGLNRRSLMLFESGPVPCHLHTTGVVPGGTLITLSNITTGRLIQQRWKSAARRTVRKKYVFLVTQLKPCSVLNIILIIR